jgi:hypothetical protein
VAKLESVVQQIKSLAVLPIKSFSKKEQRDIDKDVRPMILDIKTGELDVDAKIRELINQVSPCQMRGVMVETAVTSGSGIRPSELIEIFRGFGLEAQRPIKVAAHLRA